MHVDHLVRAVDHLDVASLEHMWVEPGFIGRGIGRALFDHALETARHAGVTKLEIESDPNAEEFYRKRGAKRIGYSVGEVDGERRLLPIMILELNHLAGSPHTHPSRSDHA